jgi:hypothetical protein
MEKNRVTHGKLFSDFPYMEKNRAIGPKSNNQCPGLNESFMYHQPSVQSSSEFDGSGLVDNLAKSLF